MKREINKQIVRLTVPAILSNITMPLLGLSDTTISGHLGSEIFIGAIAVGTMMQNVVFWLFGFLRMGTTGLTAQAFGSGSDRRCAEVFSRSFFLGVLIGLLILCLQLPLSHVLKALINPDAEVSDYALQYFYVCIWGAPAMLATMSIQGWFLGMQTTLLPMIISISVNVINIVLSILFVFVGECGFIGVAYGTLCATWFGLLLALALVVRFRRGKQLWISMRQIVKPEGLSVFFRVNSDIFLRSACIIGVSLTVTAIGARLGALTLAVNAVIVQFYIFFSYFMDGFAFTGEALCGRFAGASDYVALRQSVSQLLKFSAVMAVSFFLIYLFFYQNIVAFITDNVEVLRNIDRFKVWIILTPPLSVLAFIYDGFFIGLTATRRMLAVTAAATLAFLAISFVHVRNGLIVVELPDNDTMWAAFMTYLLLRGVLLAVQSRNVFYPSKLTLNS